MSARTCAHCGGALPEDASPRRRYCTHAHRSEAFKARRLRVARATVAADVAAPSDDATFRAAAFDLLMRQSRAIREGADPLALAAIEREAARLFGARS